MHPDTPQNPGQHPTAPRYVVVVEEKKRRNGAWHVSLIQPAGDDLDQARATGQNIAFAHQPEAAGRDVGRRDVYRLSEDSWLIIYNVPWRLGSTGHFRVSVARHVGSTG
jgi:hypothetical protein